MPVRDLCLTFVLLLGAAASAQTPAAVDFNSSRWEVFAGTAWAGPNPSNARFGGDGGLNFRIVRPINVAGEVSVCTHTAGGNTATLVDYFVGPRFSTTWSARSRVSLFADFLFGGQTMTNSNNNPEIYYMNNTSFALAGDVGFEVALTRHLAVLGQGGFVESKFEQNSLLEGNYRLRAEANVAYRF